jgi:hypothetical protein
VLTLSISSSIRSVQAQMPSDMNTRGIEYPNFRYLQHRFLDPEDKLLADAFGYTQSTWDFPGTDIIEVIAFSALGLGQSDAVQLGYTEDVWDCYINHYRFFEWSELEGLGVHDYLVAIGWTEDKWGSSSAVDAPAIFNDNWEDLTEDQRSNATEVCYFQEIWDKETLQFWTTGPPTESPTPAPTTTVSPTMAPTTESTLGDMSNAIDTVKASSLLPLVASALAIVFAL